MRFFQNILLIAGLITGNMLFAQNRIVKETGACNLWQETI